MPDGGAAAPPEPRDLRATAWNMCATRRCSLSRSGSEFALWEVLTINRLLDGFARAHAILMCNMCHNDGRLTTRASNMKQIEPALRENEAGAAGRSRGPSRDGTCGNARILDGHWLNRKNLREAVDRANRANRTNWARKSHTKSLRIAPIQARFALSCSISPPGIRYNLFFYSRQIRAI